MTTGQPRHGGVHGGGAFRQLSMTLMALVVCGCSSSVDAEDGRSLDSLDAPRVDLSLVAARAAHTASSLPAGRVFVAGGCVVDGCSVATDETFYVADDGRSASPGPDMSVARDNHTAVVLPDDRIALIGGFAGEGAGVVASLVT
jgi:Galactose oxidase, central domain